MVRFTIPKSDLYNRRLKVSAVIDKSVDLVIFTSRDDITWLTDFYTYGSNSLLFLLYDTATKLWTFVSRNLELSNMPVQDDIIPLGYSESQSLASTVLDITLKSFPHDYLCVQLDGDGPLRDLLTKDYRVILSPNSLGNFIGSLRVKKCFTEIEYHRRAASVACRSIEHVIPEIKVGVSENDIAGRLASLIISGDPDCRWPSYPPFVKFGPSSSRGHVSFEGDVLTPNQIVFIEVGASVCGYHSAVMRTIYSGKIDSETGKKITKISERVISALEFLIKNIKPGVKASELYTNTSSVIDAKGLEKELEITVDQHAKVGYSIGRGQAPDWADDPCFGLSPINNDVLVEGMVLHLIPWVQTSLGAVGFSDTVLVTKNGCENLTYLSTRSLRAKIY